MSKKSVRSSSRAGSKSSGKSPGGKKPELCSKCSNPDKNLHLLVCSHAFCPDCLKTLPKKESEKLEKDGRSSKMSNKGGKKNTATKQDYVCLVCNKPEQDFTYGECAPCKCLLNIYFFHTASWLLSYLSIRAKMNFQDTFIIKQSSTLNYNTD